MISRPRTRAAALVLALSLCAVEANAKSPGATLIDADAPIVVRADPPELFAFTDRLRGVTGPVGAAIALLRTGGAVHLGSDPFTAKGFASLGFDAKRPLWVQLGAIEGAKADKVYGRLGSAREWTPKVLRKTGKVMWRSRLIVGVRNRRRAVATLTKIASLVAKMHRVRAKDRESLAALLGARPQRGAEIERTLRQESIDAIGWVNGIDAFIVVRHGRRVATIEVLGAFAGVPIVWLRDRRKLLGPLAELNKRRGGFATKISSLGAAAAMRQRGIHLWIGSSALRTTLRALAQTERLREIATSLPQSRAQAKRFKPNSTAQCATLDELARRGAVTDMAVLTQWTGKTLKLELAWGMRNEPKWLAAMLTGQPGAVAMVHESLIAAATVLVRRPAAVASLWRPAPLVKGFAHGVRELTRCPGGSLTALAVTAWPELAGAFISDLRKIHPIAKQLVDAWGPTTVAIRRAGLDAEEASAVIEADVGAAVGSITGLFAQLFGQERLLEQVSVWGGGPLIAFSRAGGGGRAGFATGEDSLRWYLALPPGKSAGRAGLIAFGRARVDLLMDQLAGSHPQLATLASWAKTSVREGHLELRIQGKVVSATATIETVK